MVDACACSALLWSPHPDLDRRGPEPNTGRFWRETHAEMCREDITRGDGEERLLIVVGLYSDKTNLTPTHSVGTKPLGLTILNLPEKARNSDRGKRVVCQVPELPLTSKMASKKSKPKPVQSAVRECWHAGVRGALAPLRRAQQGTGTWLYVPTKGVRLCKIVLGPFSNDYPEGKQATNLKQWPSQFPCNTCWCDKGEVVQCLHIA